MNKNDILRRLRLGDDSLLAEIYDKYEEDFVRWATRFGLSRIQAKEVFHVSVVILYENVVTGKLANLSSSLKTYLFGIGKNKAMEFRREHNSSIPSMDPALFDMIAEEEEPASIEIDVDQLREALVILGDPCKKIIEMMYFQNFSQDEISRFMGYKDRDTVKSKKYKCIDRLKKLLEKRDSHEEDNS